MPIGYLVGVALVAWWTSFALAPRRWPRALAAISFRFGVALNELPFVAGYLILASTALAVAQGDIDSPSGWGGLALAVLTMAGLGVVAWRGLRARPAVDHALDRGLGAGWRTAIDEGLATRLRRRRPFARILLTPFHVRRHDVERVANISYGDAGRRHLLDVYRRRSRPSGGPTLIYFHGGGYFSGRKNREARPLLYRLASQGWVCISANYRLRPAASFPDHLIDAKKSIAWAREHGPGYGGDAEVLFVAGSSAGGHLAALAALTPTDPAFQPGFEHADTSVTAAICLYGYFGNYYGQGASSSPRAYVRSDAPPFFAAQGDHDTYSPRFLEIARGFVEELRSTSAQPVVYAELPGAQHSFDLFRSIRFETVVDAIEAFAAWVRSTRQDPSGAGYGSRRPPDPGR